MAFLFDPRFQAVDANGLPLSGATLTFYRAGTTTKISIYMDSAATTPHANPVVADSSGTFAAIFIDTSSPYKFILKTALGVTVQTVDNIISNLSGPAQQDTIASAEADQPGVDPEYYDVAYYDSNYTAFSGARYRLSLSEPSNAGKFQNANGTWYEISEPEVTPQMFGFTGVGSDADTLKFQDAIDSGFPVVLPPGTFLLTLSQTMTMEGGSVDVCLRLRPGKAKVRARVRGETTLKLKDGESTNASPKYFNIIGVNEAIDGLLLDGIVFDINGANNLINGAAGGYANDYNCAALMVSGSVGTAGADARLTNSKILHCEVLNSPGVTCIALGQSNTNSGGGGTGAVLGHNVEIAHCRFYNNGLDADDHSSVYAWCNGVDIHDCLFDHPTMSSGQSGPLAAFELHGSDNTFRNNTVRNYLWGGYLAGNYTSVSDGQWVVDNDFYCARSVLTVFNETATEPGMANIVILGNRVHVTADHQINGQPKKIFDLQPSYGAVDGLICDGNIIDHDQAATDYGAYAIKVGSLGVGTTIKNVILANNVLRGFATPITVALATDGVVENIKISGNVLCDMAPDDVTPTTTIGIFVGNTLGRVVITDNTINGVASHPYFGVYLDTGTITHLHMEGNEVDTDAVTRFSFNGSISGRRTGEQALQFLALPADSTWQIGDVAINLDNGELGSAASKYIVTGWRRVTNGTANVLNTDWLQMRVLTGN